MGETRIFGARRKAAKLLEDLRPSAAAYSRYRRRADGFLKTFGGPISASSYQGKCVTALRMRKSVIFGREYLIAYADPSWLRRASPSTNAFATPGIELGSILSPPLVFVPETKSEAGGRDFRSILEHEFVHLNQIILGTFPDAPKGTAGELLEWLLRATRVEYEANLLQLARWPRLFLPTREEHRFSLDAWCVFRGYTQGLERIAGAVIGKGIEKNEFETFLDLLPDALPPGLRRMGIEGGIGEYCAARVTQHATIAVQIMKENSMKSRGPARNPSDEILGPILKDWKPDGEPAGRDRRTGRSPRPAQKARQAPAPPF